MIHDALAVCIVLCVNCAYALGGLVAAKRCGIDLAFTRGAGPAVLFAGTLAECAAVVLHADILAQAMIIVAFGAVVAGAACDAACGYVFDAITLPCLALMLVMAALTHSLAPFALGVAAAGGSLGLLYAVTLGRGLGLGDVKLACCIGGATGALGGLEALGAAFVLGGVYAGYLLAAKRAKRGDELRFAPYLAAGMAIVILHGAPA